MGIKFKAKALRWLESTKVIIELRVEGIDVELVGPVEGQEEVIYSGGSFGLPSFIQFGGQEGDDNNRVSIVIDLETGAIEGWKKPTPQQLAEWIDESEAERQENND